MIDQPPGSTEQVKAELTALKILHAQVVSELRQAKERGDQEEAAKLREWVADLVVQRETIAPDVSLAEARKNLDRWVSSVPTTREEMLAELRSMEELQQGTAILRQVTAAIRRGDTDEPRRLLKLLCQVWNLPLECYGLDE